MRGAREKEGEGVVIERRVAHILVVLAVGVGAAGFFTGLSQERKRSSREAQPYPVTSAPAPGYRDLRDMRRGPNAHLYETAFDALEAGGPVDISAGVAAEVELPKTPEIPDDDEHLP